MSRNLQTAVSVPGACAVSTLELGILKCVCLNAFITIDAASYDS